MDPHPGRRDPAHARGGRDAHEQHAHRRHRPAPRRRGTARAHLREARRARHRRRRLVRGVGAERDEGVGRRRVERLGRPREPDGAARLVRHLGDRRRRRAGRRALPLRDHDARRHLLLKSDPYAFAGGDAARQRVAHLPLAPRVGRRRVARAAARLGAAHAADLDLRGAPRLVAPHARQPAAGLPRARGAARRLREGSRLHARRAAAGDGASVQRLVGLPGHRLLRADRALRRSGRLPRVRRRAAPAGHRRDPRLGARALPARRLGARAVRRHRAVRARGSAPRRASRLGHARLQLRPQRGAELPALERALLAARVPRRRAARRRGRLDALPRLLAQGGRVGAERVRRPRGPRRRRRSCSS